MGPFTWLVAGMAFAQDFDEDGVLDEVDSCPDIPNADQEDRDADGFGDDCDRCLFLPSETNEDSDEDGMGDACDNCPDVANYEQLDADSDNIGAACDADDADDKIGEGCVGGQALSLGAGLLLLPSLARRTRKGR